MAEQRTKKPFNTQPHSMLERRILVWGAGGHARVVADIIRCVGRSEIVGFLDNVNSERHTTEFCGATVLGGQSHQEKRARGHLVR